MIRRRVTFKIAAAAGAALLAGALAACSGGGGGGGGGGSASSNSTIVACGDLALAGVYAQIGESDNWGAEAYFKYIDAHGGILGHQVKYITLNNQSNAAQSELDAKKCIQTYHAQFIIGPESGADTESALPIAIAEQDDPDQPVLRLADQRLPGERAELLRLPRLLRRVRRRTRSPR